MPTALDDARWRGVHRGRRPVVRHAVRARLAHHVAPERGLRAEPGDRDARRSSPRTRRPRSMPGGTPSPARSPRVPHRRDGADRRVAVPPYYGAIDSTPLWLVLLGETHDWTGDDALVERLWPNAVAALAWIDDWGDRDGDGFVEYQRRAPPVSSTRAGRTRATRSAGPTGPSPRRRSPWPRSRATSSMPSAGSPAWRSAGRLRPRRPARAEATAQAAVRPSVHARHVATSRWPSTRDKRAVDTMGRTPGIACGAASCDERAAAVAEALGSPAMWSRLGRPDVRVGPARLQPDRLPHGHGLAARHGDRARAPAVRLRCGRWRLSGGLLAPPTTSGLSAAGTVLRLRPSPRPPHRSPIRSPVRRRPGRRDRR